MRLIFWYIMISSMVATFWDTTLSVLIASC